MNIPLGWLIAFASAVGGFVWLGGHVQQLFVPEEFLVIFGAAVGTLIASNKGRNLKHIGRAIASIFSKQRRVSAVANTELLSLMFALLQRIRTNGVLAIESDIEAPQNSPLFQRFPLVLQNERLMEFLLDYLRMMLDGTLTAAQLEAVMTQEIEVLHQERQSPADSLLKLADSMPAFGIVAAIFGVIHTLGGISEGRTPGQIGADIGSALVGTLFGVFSAYAIFMPVSHVLEQRAEEELKPFEALREILLANLHGFSPLVAVEYGRKVFFSDQRPSMTELEARVRQSSDDSFAKR